MSDDFTGDLSFTLTLKCEEADADFIEANLRTLLEDRIEQFLNVYDYSMTAERYKSLG